jgi:hypothetical protein
MSPKELVCPVLGTRMMGKDEIATTACFKNVTIGGIPFDVGCCFEKGDSRSKKSFVYADQDRKALVLCFNEPMKKSDMVRCGGNLKK